MKKIFIILTALLIVLLFSGCATEPAEPKIPENEEIFEESSEPGNIPKEPAVFEEPSEREEPIDTKSFMTFEEITALGCYPLWMKPYTIIIYDENGNPEIIEGGVLSEEDCIGNEMYYEIGFVDIKDKTFKIRPNTKVEYFKDGFIQNIYFRWPDGSYNLSPYSKTENAKITYYESLEEYESESGKTVTMDESQCHSVFWIADGMNLLPESTSKPMGFPRYKITFTYAGTEYCIYIDENNVFASTMLESGNYISSLNEDHFSKTEALFNEAQ